MGDALYVPFIVSWFELIRIESLSTESILKKNSYKHFCPRFVSNKCIILNRPMIFTSRLRYRLFGVLSDIRWVVNNVLVSRRMDTQNKYKARLPPESLRYDPGGVIWELLGGDVPLGPWNPLPIPELVQLNFATLY